FIASLLGQGLPLLDSALAGCVVHGVAADRIALRKGERGMLATDLLSEIPGLVNP
nr:bifunctional ADP-dependent NAD(P)H-hydrate dehydratase/NAD(P)H-hydrate epimerase [Budvicia sp.]